MILSLILLFCEILCNSDPNENFIIHNNTSYSDNNVHYVRDVNESTNSEPPNDKKPDLVTLEFPADLYEKEGEDVYKVIKKKMDDFFGETMVDEMLKYESSDGVLDYMSKADFHNSWMNVILNTVGEKLKSTEKIPLDKIHSRKDCKKACRKNHRDLNKYLQHTFESVASNLMHEDLRFVISQDPRKSYSYIRTAENKYECKCLDAGYIIKVSPKLKELIEKRYFQNDGKSLAEKISEVDSNTEISSVGDLISWRRAGNLAMYMVGWRSRVKRNAAFGDFVEEHGLILIILFVCCHCLFYPYLAYVLVLYLAQFVFE